MLARSTTPRRPPGPLLAACRGIGGFRAEASVRTWLYRLATNTCLNHRRTTRRRPQAAALPPETAPPPNGTDPVTWLQPYPDALLDGLPEPSPGPESRIETRESASLAFIRRAAEPRGRGSPVCATSWVHRWRGRRDLGNVVGRCCHPAEPGPDDVAVAAPFGPGPRATDPGRDHAGPPARLPTWERPGDVSRQESSRHHRVGVAAAAPCTGRRTVRRSCGLRTQVGTSDDLTGTGAGGSSTPAAAATPGRPQGCSS